MIKPQPILSKKFSTFFLFSLLLSCLFLPQLHADAGISAPHKMVIQVNSKDALSQKMALMNAGNLKSQLGKDNVDIEIVVYGPGIGMIKSDSRFAKKIQSLQEKNVKISVCGGTLKMLEKKHGKAPELVPGVSKVKTGALRILELQEKGYAYMRP